MFIRVLITCGFLGIGQARPQLQATLMERMTNVLFRMLNDPLTRAALSAGGEDSLETNSSQHSQQQVKKTRIIIMYFSRSTFRSKI